MTETLTETADELTPEQYALLDALRDVALSQDAPYAKIATEQIARLAGEAFGYPMPAPVERVGGVAGFLYGNPRRDQLGPFRGTAEKAAGGEVQRYPHLVRVSREELGMPPGTAPDAAEADRWPFKPGDVVRDSGEDADHGAWLDAAPVGVVVADQHEKHWRSTEDAWIADWPTAADIVAGTLTGHALHRRYGPVTVVSVPDPQEACTDDAPAGDA